MKYLTFVVPSYNAEKYLDKCLSTLVLGGDDVEVIVVNDGSKDSTSAKAHEWENKYPNIIKVIDKENGGHGSGVNAGIKNAKGLYFKCVDSDDWVDEEAYKKVLDTIKKHHKEKVNVDLYFCNYVFERPDLNKHHVVTMHHHLASGKVVGWKDVHLGITEYFMMHAMIYKTEVLRKSKTVLLEHTFYVDNIFVYQPLPCVKDIYYIDTDFYRYYVGRPDQSVTLENMTKRYDHQVRVMEANATRYSLSELNALEKPLKKIMIHDLYAKQYLTLFYITIGNNKEKTACYKAYMKNFKEKQPELYNKIVYRSLWTFQYFLIKPVRNLMVKIGYKLIIDSTGWN